MYHVLQAIQPHFPRHTTRAHNLPAELHALHVLYCTVAVCTTSTACRKAVDSHFTLYGFILYEAVDGILDHDRVAQSTHDDVTEAQHAQLMPQAAQAHI